ncbi:MAG TPA: surface-adhesin E family protein [Thermodesulfovibrionales bacterium]|nr:surface-adhesin E family protein [Thermodesulfovibrionales bacterium]
MNAAALGLRLVPFYFLPAVAAVLLLVCLSAGEAANWVLVGISEDGNASLYVDKESINSSLQNVTSAWTKFLFGNPESFESKMISQMLVHIEFDCSEKRRRRIELTFDYDNGSRETFSPDRQWYPVKPDTLENEAYRYLCK